MITSVSHYGHMGMFNECMECAALFPDSLRCNKLIWFSQTISIFHVIQGQHTETALYSIIVTLTFRSIYQP